MDMAAGRPMLVPSKPKMKIGDIMSEMTPEEVEQRMTLLTGTVDYADVAGADEAVEEIQAQVGNGHVILGLSGGVDSSVAAALIHRAIDDQLT